MRTTSSRLTRQVLAAGLVLLVALPAGAGDLRVLLEAETGVRNDGNLRQVGRGTAAAGEPLDRAQAQDVGRAGLNLQLSYSARERFDLALGYSPSYERSFDDTNLAGTTHRLDLGLHALLSRRFSLEARERLLSSPGLDLYAPLASPQSIAVTRRGRELFHNLDVALKNELSRRTTLEVGVNNSIRKFEDSGLTDSTTVGATAGAAFHFTPERELAFTAGLQQITWERAQGRDADVRTLEASYTHPFGREARVRLEAGQFYVKQNGSATASSAAGSGAPRRTSKNGFRGGINVSQERRLFHWSLGYRHDIAPGYGIARPVVADAAFVGLSTNIGRRLTLGLDGNASRQRELDRTARTVPAGGDGTGTLTATDESSLTRFAAGTFRLSWALTQSLRLTGGYSRIWQRSRIPLFDDLSYDRYFLGLAFRIYHTGERPRAPEELERRGEPTDADADAGPDAP